MQPAVRSQFLIGKIAVSDTRFANPFAYPPPSQFLIGKIAANLAT